tara:strand:- start:23 stop:514 length:492 start_codon:yes stop_codon:yes gene_type:complete
MNRYGQTAGYGLWPFGEKEEEEDFDPLKAWAEQKATIPPGIYAGAGGYYYRISGDKRLYVHTGRRSDWNWTKVTDKKAEGAIRNEIANRKKLTPVQESQAKAALRALAVPAPSTAPKLEDLPTEVQKAPSAIQKAAIMPTWVVPLGLAGAASLILYMIIRRRG